MRVNDRIEELTGSLPKGAVLRHNIHDEDLPDALRPDAFEDLEAERV